MEVSCEILMKVSCEIFKEISNEILVEVSDEILTEFSYEIWCGGGQPTKPVPLARVTLKLSRNIEGLAIY